MRRAIVAALVAALSVVAPSVTTAAASAASGPIGASCADIKAADATAGDGEYLVAPTSAPAGTGFTVWCHDMAGTPTEYLTLANVGTDLNFAQVTAGGHYWGTNKRTSFTRIRLDVDTLEVDVTDTTFSATTGAIHGDSSPAAYATANGCAWDWNGIANVDLRGTAFAVTGGTSAFGSNGWPGGWENHGDATALDDADQAFALRGGGFCGGAHPVAFPYLPLTLLTPTELPPPDADGDGVADADDNCVDVANADQVDTDGDGEGDACDADDDGDGTLDEDDSYPLDPTRDGDEDDDGIKDTPAPTNKDQCKNGGWATFNNPTFRNQGQCVSSVVSNRR